MKISIVLFFLLFFTINLSAQSTKDSLYALWKNETEADTTRFKAIKKYIWENYLYSQPDSAYIIAKEQLAYAVQRKNFLKQADAYNTMGVSWYFRSGFDSAVYYYDKALDCIRQTGDYKAASGILNNIGAIEMARGNFVVAIEKFNQGLKIEESKNNRLAMANCHLNIGIIYYRQVDYDRAREHYLIADDLYKEIGNEAARGNVLNNLGVMENELKNSDAAIMYHQQAYEIRKSYNDKLGMGASLTNLATVYGDGGDYEKALPLFLDALKYAQEVHDLGTISSVYFNIANIYLFQNRVDEAIVTALKAYDIAESVGAIYEQKQAAELLYKAYKNRADFKKSLEMHEVLLTLNDSITSDENKGAVIRQEYKTEYEKMAVADSLKTLEAQKLQQAELETERAENGRRQQFSIFLVVGLIAALVFGFVIYKRLRITREQKAIIEEQKVVVTHAFEQVEEKNKEILDSITYAKRIQSAILPSQKMIAQTFKESFVLYKPKDIVAGDFYWMHANDDLVLFAAADCTGHGVPGALVSVVCNNALNRSVREFGLTDPGKILDKTREIVIHEFEKSDENVKDGMDISLCALSLSTRKLVWAGANNPLWILRKSMREMHLDSSQKEPVDVEKWNGYILEETKADKQPIGKFADAKPFNSHHIQLFAGDIIYIFTDGIQDQFGGEKGKKFKAANLKELICSSGKLSMPDQLIHIQTSFENWRGSLEQIDDVCLIGVRV